MKILRITAQGLPLFKKDLDICFYTQQRVCEEDKDSLYRLTDNYYLHSACAFIGINASGKTSVLKVISLALNIVKMSPSIMWRQKHSWRSEECYNSHIFL